MAAGWSDTSRDTFAFGVLGNVSDCVTFDSPPADAQDGHERACIYMMMTMMMQGRYVEAECLSVLTDAETEQVGACGSR